MTKVRPFSATLKAVFSFTVSAFVIAALATAAFSPAASASTKHSLFQFPGRAAQPLVLSVSAAPAQVGSHGGAVVISGKLKRASSCQLRLLSHQSFPVVYASNARHCAGNFSAHVTIGANTTPVERSVAFALVARNGKRRFAGMFYVSLAPLVRNKRLLRTTSPAAARPGRTTSTGPAPRTTTTTTPAGETTTTGPTSTGPTSTGPTSTGPTSTGPTSTGPTSTGPTPPTTAAVTTTTTSAGTATGGPPVTAEESPNWSGYSTKGGPFAYAGGTFTVPSLASGASCDQIASQWVGVDGAIGTNDDLVQAGVTEAEMDPSDSGTCQSGQFYAWAWWEIIPAAATNVYSVPVHAGDSVTVSIRQVQPGTWQMSLTDNSDGQGFSVQHAYSGPGQSAEWITEAPAAPQGSNQICPTTAVTSFAGSDICPLAPYTPPVSFSGLALSPSSSVTEVDQIAMVQGAGAVSTPSPSSSLSQLMARGFTTAYTA
jgi:Peptidase A4 family